MKSPHYLRKSLMMLCLCLLVISAFAQVQSQNEQFQPEPYQGGKDVVWVPTPDTLVEKMLDMAEVTPDDYVIDLGSGDGRTVIAAAKRGAKALGVEYNPQMVELSIERAEAAGVSDKVRFIEADLFETDFSSATVVTMFLLTAINLELRPKILDLKPGTRIVSNTFGMDDWTPDEKVEMDIDDSTFDTALLWIVPAKVEGIWRLPQGKLSLTQHFQMVSGTLETRGSSISIMNGKLYGDHISFSAGEDRYTGRVNGNAIEGTVTSNGTDSKWDAVHVTE